MAKCARCGQEIYSEPKCPHCGGEPSRSIFDRGMNKVARATGTVLEKSVQITDKVVQEAKPVVKTVAQESKKGLSKAKKETLKVAKQLKEEGK